MNKKVLLILIFVIVIGIIAAIGGIIFIKNSDKSYKLEEVTSFDYFKLYENNKYGVIDKNGKIIIEAKYENVDIPNPSKAVFIVYSNYNSQNGEYQTQVLNGKNEKILTEYETVLPIQLKESNRINNTINFDIELSLECIPSFYKEDDIVELLIIMVKR